jgi:hypothetical protein
MSDHPTGPASNPDPNAACSALTPTRRKLKSATPLPISRPGPASNPDPNARYPVADDSRGWTSGPGGPMPRRFHVMIHDDTGETISSIITAPDAITASAIAGVQLGADVIVNVDVEPWD